MKGYHTHTHSLINTGFPSELNVLQPSTTAECDLVADLAAAQEEQRPVRSHGNGVRVETSGWTSAVSWTNSAAGAG